MKNIDIVSKNGDIVSCLLAKPEQTEPTAFVIVIHGFGSSKESPTAQMMLEALPKAGFGAIGLDLPGHGTHDSFDIPLTIQNCLDTIGTVESYLIETYCFPRIFYFSSSFGAYLTLLYLATRRHTGDKAFLRSAAVNMPELFGAGSTLEGMPSGILEQFEKQGYIILNDAGPAPVKVTKEFVEGLTANKLFDLVPTAIEEGRFDGIELEMVHGEKDAVIDPAQAITFSEICSIPITVLEGEDHTLSTDPASPSKVSELAVSFYQD